MPTTRGLLALALLVLCAAFPAQALGQSAGDEQYTDPFQGEENSGGGGGQSGNSSQGQGGGDTGETPAPAPDDGSGTVTPDSTVTPETGTATGTTGSSEDPAGLPRTGLPLGVLAALGAGLLLSGLALRRSA